MRVRVRRHHSCSAILLSGFAARQQASDSGHIQRLCAQLRVGGALITESTVGRVLKALADSGFFHFDGVLLDTQAFIVLGNLLGFHWEKRQGRSTLPLMCPHVTDCSIGFPAPI